ncbi:hypothetical protein ACQ0P8_06540 [Halodesulfovibrio aestuarii]|uniref:hypothetical protein n=1 Tax=Halodesulfovibrio aestuarii TaxID=126333 RepID=UPI003D3186C3
MLLNSFKLFKNNSEIRSIPFELGLNIITNREGIGHSGNSVGKSTLSRVVDFLFLGSIDPVYIDDEFKQPNIDIQKLFEENDIIAQLNFTGADFGVHRMERRLAIDSDDDAFYFDGNKLSQSKYEDQIKKFCFGITTDRFSVRYAITKFIRNTNERMLNTTQFLDKRVPTEGKEYSELYLYLFGFQDSEKLGEKRLATNLVNRRAKNLRVINALIKEQKNKTQLKELAKLIKKIEDEILSFNFSSEQKDPISELSQLQRQEDDITKEVLSIERKIKNINETVKNLSSSLGGYLTTELEEIYAYANITITSAIKDLKEVSQFPRQARSE